MRQRYDLILSFGSACSCSQVLRQAGLQYLSFPYDWVVLNRADDMRVRADFTCEDFRGWFDRADLVRGTEHDHPLAVNGELRGNNPPCTYHNVRTQHAFHHDFHRNDTLDSAYETVAAKYRRRQERLRHGLESSARVLLVRLDRPNQPEPTDPADCAYALERMSRRFPNARFDCLLITCEPGRPAATPAEDTPGDRITRLAFDYRSRDPNAHDYDPDFGLLAKVLDDRYAVRDYRTRAEKATRRRAVNLQKYQLNGAENAFQYRCIKLRQRLEKIRQKLGFGK